MIGKQHLLTLLALTATASTTIGAGLAVFQNGLNGYTGAQDVELNAEFNLPRGLGLGEQVAMSIDESNGGFISQGALRFDDIFDTGQGPASFDRIPVGEEIVFAEIRLLVVSQADGDATISFNRVLGADQNRLEGPGGDLDTPWDDQDTWRSLGGDQEAEGNPPVLEEKPIEVGNSTTLAVGNEAVSATLNGFDPVTGEQFGIMSQDQNLLDFDNESLESGLASINVTSDLQLWQQDPTSNFGWAIDNNTTNGWDFLSSNFTIANSGDPSLGAEPGQIELLFETLGLDEFEVRPQLRVAFGIAGDIDLDDDIDGDDYAIIRSNLGNESIFRGEPGDLDFDKDVDMQDFSRFKIAYELENGPGSFAALAAGASVPEPATCATVALAAGFAACLRRRLS